MELGTCYAIGTAIIGILYIMAFVLGIKLKLTGAIICICSAVGLYILMVLSAIIVLSL